MSEGNKANCKGCGQPIRFIQIGVKENKKKKFAVVDEKPISSWVKIMNRWIQLRVWKNHLDVCPNRNYSGGSGAPVDDGDPFK